MSRKKGLMDKLKSEESVTNPDTTAASFLFNNKKAKKIIQKIYGYYGNTPYFVTSFSLVF